MADSVLASDLARAGQAGVRTNFEIQFNNLQNTLIGRFNDQVDEINNSKTSSSHRISALQDTSKKLVAALPLLEEYREGNRNNYGQLEALQEELTALRATISDDDNVTAQEVADFQSKRDEAATRLKNIYIFVHDDFNDGEVVQKLKQSLSELEALTPVVGTLSGDNAGVTDFLTELDNKVANAISTTSNTISSVLFLETSLQSEFAIADSELLELTFEEQEKRNSRIEDLKVDLGNTLRVISLSFEVNSSFASALTDRLQQASPPAGSILNIFS
jgi:chromosome segregation ATPase